jgi:aryl-alcohol dehydrogenase-like predicted oxidoreductase
MFFVCSQPACAAWQKPPRPKVAKRNGLHRRTGPIVWRADKQGQHMQYKILGPSDLKVSTLCLGSMTWGTRNTGDEAHAQIDMALDHGVNFIDTAEMYPTYPVLAKTIGRTEEIIGDWLARSGRRGDVIVATKASGEGLKVVRDGAPISAATLRQSVAGSLKRLQTDVIDLYQLHWPNRGSFHFRQNWDFDPTGQSRAETEAGMLDILQEMQRQVDAGAVRYFGLSNESAWGAAKWLHLAQVNNLPRVQSIQNEYSLLCRHYDLDLAELSHHEDVGLLAFSPQAAGLLSGKYGPDVTPADSRRAANADLGGRITPKVWPAIEAYHEVARRHGLDPLHMSLAWCQGRPFMASVIIGATTPEQLQHALAAADMELSGEVLRDISAVHRRHPMPF